jgi:hypothetical protein
LEENIMKKFTMLAGASLLVIAGSAFAEQSLTDAQMDGVSAGAVLLLQGTGIGNAYGNVISNLLGNTTSNTGAQADPTGAIMAALPSAFGFANNTSVGSSVTDGALIGGTLSQSTSSAAASLF